MLNFGLLGYPLGHSYSAKYFSEKFKTEKIDAKYENFEFSCLEEGLSSILQNPNLVGFNVTIPFKEKIIPFLQEISPEAKAIGAVNTVKVERDNKGNAFLKGFNTDIIGFKKTIAPHLSHYKKALILGTGGASKAIAVGLKDLGLDISFVSRKTHPEYFEYKDLTSELIAEFHVIVNCTPVGMFPHVNECPKIPYQFLTSNHLLYDLVYNPEETLFMKKGQTFGATVVNGLEMLHIQAQEAWKIWVH